MKRPTMLFRALVGEILQQHDLPSSKDLATVLSRIEKEGDSFLAITLPTLGSCLEQALEVGFITRDAHPGFGCDRRGTLPKFLKGLFMKIFSENGCLKDDACSDAIFGIRQICSWAKKPLEPCSNSRNKAAIRKYKVIEEDLKRYDVITESEDPVLRRVSNLLWCGNIFSDLATQSLKCYHGSGATSERKTKNARWDITTWNQRSEEYFPVADHAIHSYSAFPNLDNIVFLSEEDELPVRVVLVPKTKKTPRVIAVEPIHMMFMQQGLMRYLTKKIETNALTSDSIRFRDQHANRNGAQSSSLNRKRATMDLSDASDRVHLNLVKNIFRDSPLLPYLLASRSSRARLPDGEIVNLTKFASMGSATCFPVEAMVFYTVIQCALHYHSGITPTFASIKRFSRVIDVYGDDLLVPSYSREIVQTALEALGLRVNANKSFNKGFFRESCGGDYYKGYDVTPVYLRHQLPEKLNHSTIAQFQSLVETSNQLYKKGLWKTCQLLRNMIQTSARKKIPRSPYSGEGLVFYSRMYTTDLRWNADTQSYAQKRIVLKPVKEKDECSEYGMLLKYLLTSAFSAPGCNDHLRTKVVNDYASSVKLGAFKVKHRWVPATIGGLVG